MHNYCRNTDFIFGKFDFEKDIYTWVDLMPDKYGITVQRWYYDRCDRMLE